MTARADELHAVAPPVVLAAVGLRGSRRLWLALVLACVGVPPALALTGLSLRGASAWATGALVALLIGIAAVYRRTGRSDSLASGAEASAQLVVFSATMALWSYIAMRSAVPLHDALLERADLAIGFHWSSVAGWVYARDALQLALVLVYASIAPQASCCALYLGLRGRSAELLWALVVSGAITIATSAVVPAIGHIAAAPHVPDLLALRSGGAFRIDLMRMQGLIAFPSFHTTMAVLVAWSLRRERRWLVVAACVLEVAMVFSAITQGGHYLVDVLAGVAVAVIGAAVARYLIA